MPKHVAAKNPRNLPRFFGSARLSRTTGGCYVEGNTHGKAFETLAVADAPGDI